MRKHGRLLLRQLDMESREEQLQLHQRIAPAHWADVQPRARADADAHMATRNPGDLPKVLPANRALNTVPRSTLALLNLVGTTLLQLPLYGLQLLLVLVAKLAHLGPQFGASVLVVLLGALRVVQFRQNLISLLENVAHECLQNCRVGGDREEARHGG